MATAAGGENGRARGKGRTAQSLNRIKWGLQGWKRVQKGGWHRGQWRGRRAGGNGNLVSGGDIV
eukprot:scaffold2452_cov194-Amphora_coffeaeformis.AAC.2